MAAGSYPRRYYRKFIVELSERDDEARRGIATLKCLELEVVRKALGFGGPPHHRQQEDFMREAIRRAEDWQPANRTPDVLQDRELFLRPCFLGFTRPATV